ncbi:hypothetical protein GCM10027093_40000 [Paraburkholderia jirisanensis]
MTSISSLNTANLLASLDQTNTTKTSPVAKTSLSPAAPPTTPATSVTLAQAAAGASSPVYALYTAYQPVWENTASDPVSLRIAGNMAVLTGAQQFNGLGAAVLKQLSSTGAGFSQSVLLTDGNQSAAAIASTQAQLHKSAANQITLDVTTKSGATVEISLDSDTDGLGVQVNVTNGTLTAADRNALKGLATSFQSAIDGLTSDTPTLNISGLLQYDAKDFSSIDFNAVVQGASGKQTVNLHADSQQRLLKSSGPDGSINLSVNMSTLATIGGSAQQQDAAIKSYLQQFNNAQQRGHGNTALMSSFDDAFTAMNSNYSITPATGAASTAAALMNGSDRSLLSGLADFTASVVQTPRQSNPYRLDEYDAFSYQVSQSTQISSGGPLGASIKQQQNSQLHASFHQAIPGSGGLALTNDRKSQNYDFVQIADSASSVANITFKDGKLLGATLQQSAGQSTHTREYEQGALVKDTNTSENGSWSKDFLRLLNDASLSGVGGGQTLAAVSQYSILQADPSRLQAAG